jgi:hypothetical protein
MTQDDGIRALLGEAVADVEPRHGLDSIRVRSARRPPRRWAWSVGAVVLATAGTITTVAVVSDRAGAPTAGPGPVTRNAGTSGPVETVYFVGDTGAGRRLFPELHRTASRDEALSEAVDDAYGGIATDPDYRSLWPAGTRMQTAQLHGGVLSVDLSGPVAVRPPGMTQADASLSLQQLVYTAQGVVGRKLPVTFLIGGEPTATLLGEPTDAPVAAASADVTLAQVSVTSPGDGSTVTSPFTVTGMASAFEANVPWELLSSGAVVRRGFALAQECCTLSRYSFTVEAPAGQYTLVVHDEDPSGGEGNPPTRDTKRVTVR